MKELKIDVPEGYEIDKENSTFECIKFKPIEERWRDNTETGITGYYITNRSQIALYATCNSPKNYNVFATKKQAKSALAMARISQIMANDKRFGGVITDEEWTNPYIYKYVIKNCNGTIIIDSSILTYYFLAFHTQEQCDFFLKENKDLVKDYLMID